MSKMKITHIPANKGSQQEMLPHRNAVAQLTKGDPAQRSLNNYAKLTPAGANAMGSNINGFGGATGGA